MGIRITTWNVNGIRNPFQYQPWRDKRTFEGMFDALEADIVVFQETKIQRKDLRDDMVLVPGWDCYFSLPRHKKGYSGVVIYTRNSKVAPIRAEEGITGVLCPPNSSTCFKDLPDGEHIGGYPNADQLATTNVDPVTLDSEGRCVILEFPAFILLGVYCPAMRDESRDDFRLGFLNLLDARIRNLVAKGKRIILTGDLNISRDERDHPNAEESMRKHGLAGEEFVSTPSRRLFNQMLVDGKVFGPRDEGREEPIMWDICRSFHPDRKGMFTCWETKINARPGNYGSRIDYVICSADMKDWFCDSNIQEGLLGSDHCPVYAVFKDTVPIDGVSTNLLDIMNPPGIFEHGKRVSEYSTKNLLPMSGKLIPEFDRRKNIKDMFSRKPSLKSQTSNLATLETAPEVTPQHVGDIEPTSAALSATPSEVEDSTSITASQETSQTSTFSEPTVSKRPLAPKRAQKPDTAAPPPKRTKLGNNAADKSGPGKGQQSLAGFFKSKATPSASPNGAIEQPPKAEEAVKHTTPSKPMTVHVAMATKLLEPTSAFAKDGLPVERSHASTTGDNKTAQEEADENDLIDPIVSKESWSKLFQKRDVPRCEHNDPCISYLTKKPGINCGRTFYLCPRPLGPSGNKESGTQWRCPTFIWASDWKGSSAGQNS